MADIKWSAFSTTATSTSGDTLVGLHSGNNYQFGLSPIPSAKGLTIWDANSNLSANNFLANYATTPTAASSTALTIASAYYQYWTGTSTQTVTLPYLTTPVGTSFYFVNNSTGNVTVEASGGQTVQVMAGSSTCLFTCIAANGTTAASWNADYFVNADVMGAVLLAPGGSQTITGNYTLQAYNLTATNTLTGGNLQLAGNTLSATNSNGTLTLTGNGTGPVTIGNATPIGVTSSGLLQVIGGASPGFAIGSFANGASGPFIDFVKSRNTTPGSFTIVSTGDTIGELAWSADNGSAYALASQILVTATGAVSAGVVPTNMAISTATSAGALTTAININSAQIVTKPLNPNFFATLGTKQSNVTGDNTTQALICDTAVTNVGSPYNTSTGVYTAPVAGFYTFSATLTLSGLAYPTNTSITAFWFVNSTTYYCIFTSVPPTLTSNTIILNVSINVQLALNSTISLQAKVAGGTKVVSFDTTSWISGSLLG